jgi:hypothetical protein
VTLADLGELVIGMDGLEHGGAFLFGVGGGADGPGAVLRADGDRVIARRWPTGPVRDALGSAAHESNGAAGGDERTGECPG